MNYRLVPTLVISLLFGLLSIAQDSNQTIIGASLGFGTQQAFPFNNDDYTHNNYFIKGQLNYQLLSKQKFQIQFTAEPTLFYLEHQMIDTFYITPERGSDYLEQRARFLQPISYFEFGVGLGLICSYEFVPNSSLYVMGTVGPTLISKETERLARGFAFSDIAGAGFRTGTQKWKIDARISVRHLSNAGLLFPNGGHNSINFEVGLLFPLR